MAFDRRPRIAQARCGLRLLGPEERGDELGGRSNAEIYATICSLLGVTPDPTLFGEVVTVEPVRAPARSAVVVAVSAARWAREMARNRAREMVEAAFGRGVDPPVDFMSRLTRGRWPP